MKLYTKTICGKCMFVKSMINGLGVDCEFINMDENEEARQLVLAAGLMTAPVLEIDGELIGHEGEIMERLQALEG